MAKSDQESFYHKVEMLEDLVQRQQKALEMAKHLLDLKDKLVELCEEETEVYKKECKRLIKSLIISAIGFAAIGVISVIRLLA